MRPSKSMCLDTSNPFPLSDVVRFLNLLEGETTDAYLKGISKRG